MRIDLGRRRAAVALLLLAAAGVAPACGDRIARHGGQMNDDHGEMNVELVHRARSVAFHLEDHGQPVATKGAMALVDIRRGSTGWSSKLQADGSNRFVTKLPTVLLAGDIVKVHVSFPNGSIASAQFNFGAVPKRPKPFSSVGIATGRHPP